MDILHTGPVMTDPTACPCVQRTRIKDDSASYREWSGDGDNRAMFEKGGFLIYRQLFPVEKVEEVKQNISTIIQEWLEKFDGTAVDDLAQDELVNR